MACTKFASLRCTVTVVALKGAVRRGLIRPVLSYTPLATHSTPRAQETQTPRPEPPELGPGRTLRNAETRARSLLRRRERASIDYQCADYRFLPTRVRGTSGRAFHLCSESVAATSKPGNAVLGSAYWAICFVVYPRVWSRWTKCDFLVCFYFRVGIVGVRLRPCLNEGGFVFGSAPSYFSRTGFGCKNVH